jgi:hypothetical protein
MLSLVLSYLRKLKTTHLRLWVPEKAFLTQAFTHE